MKTPCTSCHGEGFIDGGAWRCGGVGEVEVILNDRERKMLSQALGLLHRTQPINRRHGRPASPREVVSLGRKLGLTLRDRHRETQEATPAVGQPTETETAPATA